MTRECSLRPTCFEHQHLRVATCVMNVDLYSCLLGGGGGGYRVSSVILKRQDIKKSNYIKHMPNYVGEIIHTVCMNA